MIVYMNSVQQGNYGPEVGAASKGPWCPPGRYVEQHDGRCYCAYPQYSVKPRCLSEQPPCNVEQYGNGYNYYRGDKQGYITHGRRRIES